MDFLLNPNIAYLILLGGILLILMSIATPGTGWLEVGAFFCVILAGYAIYSLSFNWWAMVLILLSFVPFVYAVQKPKREAYLGLSILLLILGSVFLFTTEGWKPSVNPFVAFATSGLVALLLWSVVRKVMQAAGVRPSHDLEALVGSTGTAKSKIHQDGSVYVAGELWSARSEKSIPAGSSVRVISREGFILVVEKDD